MSQTKSNWILILALALGMAGLVIIFILISPQKINQVRDELLPRLSSTPEYRETLTVELYFGSRISPGLVVEARQIAKLPQLTDQAQEIIIQLLKGPQTKQSIATIPEGTRLRGLYIDEAGCAYVDFTHHISQNHPGGSYAELQTIYSVVNTLTTNLEPIKMVKILVDGAEIDTLVGHVDTRYPIAFQEL